MGLINLLFGGNTKPIEAPETKMIGPVPVKTVEVGSAGTEIYAGYLSEDYLSVAQGKDWSDKIDTMRRSDANVKMVLSALKSPLKSSNWYFVEKEDSEAARMQKMLLEKALFEDINRSFTKLLGEILTFVDFGYSVFDITHQVKNDKELGTYNTLKSISFRSQRTIERWNVDHSGNLLSVTQVSYGDTGVSVDMDAKFLLHFAPDQEGDNFEGVSTLRPIYGNWLRKNKFLQLLAAGVEKYAIPTPVLKTPDGVTGKPEFAEAKKSLQCYTSNQANYLILPNGYELEFNNVSIDTDKIRQTINAENQEMVNSILASFLLLGQNGAGSLALSSNLSNFFAQTITYLADHIVEQLERKVFKPLIQMNFGTDKVLVELRCDNLEEKADKAWAETIGSLISTGAISRDADTEEYIREKFKLPKKIVEQEKTDQPVSAQQSEDIQQQALNGAQVAPLIDVIQKVASGLLPRESALNILQFAFQLSKEDAEKTLSNAGNSFTIDQNAVAQLSEKKKTKKKVNDSYPNIIRSNSELMQSAGNAYLNQFAKSYIASIMRYASKANESDKIKAPINATVPSISRYIDALAIINSAAYIKVSDTVEKEFKTKRSLAEYNLATTSLKKVDDAIKAIKEAQKLLDKAETPEQYQAAIAVMDKAIEKGSSLLAYVKSSDAKLIKAKAEVFAETQKNDIIKAIDLQYQSSLPSVTDPFELENDMMVAAKDQIDKLVPVGSDVQSSQVVNESILSNTKRYEEETGDQIVSYTYIAVDDEVTTDLCRELNGATFAANDPNLFKYTCPLHFNCRSYMQVNTAAMRDNPQITGLPKLSKKAQSQIQF